MMSIKIFLCAGKFSHQVNVVIKERWQRNELPLFIKKIPCSTKPLSKPMLGFKIDRTTFNMYFHSEKYPNLQLSRHVGKGWDGLTHWGRVTHICVCKITIIDSDNGLAPGRHQAIIQINAGILLIGPLGTNFTEILIRIQTFSLKKMRLKMSSAKWRPFCLGVKVIIC